MQHSAPALDDFISSVIGQADPALGAEWTKLVQGKDVKSGAPATKTYDPLDPQVQFRMLTEAQHHRGLQARVVSVQPGVGQGRRVVRDRAA